MSPLRRSTGNMYPWVTHMHTHLGGRCPHRCSYCYVQARRPARYQGALRLVEKELDEPYTSAKTVGEARAAGFDRPVVFIDHCNDMWAEEVPPQWVERIVTHVLKWPGSDYVFQTKNPRGYSAYVNVIPASSLLGVTIESTFPTEAVSMAPDPCERYRAFRRLPWRRKFVTIEPIMRLQVGLMIHWITDLQPEFVNIGADSKKTHLPEPSAEEIRALIAALESVTEVRGKHNLARILR